jgi:hypothetical protein
MVLSADWHLQENAWTPHPDLAGDAYCGLGQAATPVRRARPAPRRPRRPVRLPPGSSRDVLVAGTQVSRLASTRSGCHPRT